MLARSSTSSETGLSNVIASTSALIFLGTPHRGRPDLAAVGGWARSLASALRMETTPALLDALALKTTDLERAHEAFSGLWSKYDFRVKTFQEGLGLTGVNLGILGNKVVPEHSSTIGDPRENAETLQANQMDMCRFTGPDDPNYAKVGGEISLIYSSITKLPPPGIQQTTIHTTLSRATPSGQASSKHDERASGHDDSLTNVQRLAIQSLSFPEMNTRRHTIDAPADKTCQWLFDHKIYMDWFSGASRDLHSGLLSLRGNPGVGKSTLLNEAFRRTLLDAESSKHRVIGAFFNANGHSTHVETSPAYILRCLAYQLLHQDSELVAMFMETWRAKQMLGDVATMAPLWSYEELRCLLRPLLLRRSNRRTFVFIDALDECDPESLRAFAYFWQTLTETAHGDAVDLNVCISSRHFPTITLRNCAEISVEHHNSSDIAAYVERHFSLPRYVSQYKLLAERLVTRSQGVFLWAILAVDELLQRYDEGKEPLFLLHHLDAVPLGLANVYQKICNTMAVPHSALALRLFQWAILANKPLRLHEWHHIMAFIQDPVPTSLQHCRTGASFTNDDAQLEKQIRSISRGLVEVAHIRSSLEDASELLSVRAGAGSLDAEDGDTRLVRVIHDSVRAHCLKPNGGFATLETSNNNLEDCATLDDFVGKGHISSMHTCIDYMNISELDSLVRARLDAARRDMYSLPMQRGHTAVGTDGQFNIKTQFPSELASKAKRAGADRKGRHSVPAVQILPLTNEMLYELEQEAQPVVNLQERVVHWLLGVRDRPAGDPESVSEAQQVQMPDKLETHHSSIKSQVLEDSPSLLNYALFQLFTHARLADANMCDPQSIIDRLSNKGTWTRFLALREDLPQQQR